LFEVGSLTGKIVALWNLSKDFSVNHNIIEVVASTFVMEFNLKSMKKSVALIILLGILFASCSQYTCPTYSKAPQKNAVKGARI
jgi:hypothetical protein